MMAVYIGTDPDCTVLMFGAVLSGSAVLWSVLTAFMVLFLSLCMTTIMEL